MDGYPSGHGADLAAFLSDRVLVNGFGTDTPAKASNGVGCMAASLVMALKEEAGIGGIYLVAPGTEDHGEEYIYTIAGARPDPASGQTARPSLKVQAVHGGWGDSPRSLTTLYEGPADGFDPNAATGEE